MTNDQLDRLRDIETGVTNSDESGIRTRWASGGEMLKLRGNNKQLPRGVMPRLVKDLGVSRSEVSARMAFVEQFETDDDVSNAIRTYKTWFGIKQHGLSKGLRKASPKAAPEPGDARIRRFKDFVTNIDPATVSDVDLKLLTELVAEIAGKRKDAASLQRQVA